MALGQIDVSTFRKDGDPDWTAGLTAAWNYAQANGGTLKFSPGVYNIGASIPTITNPNVNIEGCGQAALLTCNPGVVGIIFISFAVWPGDSQHGGYVRDLALSGFNGASQVTNRSNIGIHLVDTCGMLFSNISERNFLKANFIETTKTWDERNKWYAITGENNTDMFSLFKDASGTVSVEHSSYRDIYFNTYAGGDSVFHLTGVSMGNTTIDHVDGNFSNATGNAYIFLLDGNACITGEITGFPESNVGSGAGAYAFWANLDSTNKASNWVTAGGSLSVNNGSMWGGNGWGQGCQIFRQHGPQYLGTLTTTSTSVSGTTHYDKFTHQGINPMSNLFVMAENSIAASMLTHVYLAPSNTGWGFVNIVHSGLAGGVYSVWCQ